jgi:ABC-type antimicrobial peptide transport system permease subunit
MALTGLGVAIGVVGAGIASRALVTLLFRITPLDAITYLGVAALLGGVSMLACAMPAWRAARVRSSVALRFE